MRPPASIPKSIALYQNYPNPFNPGTRIDYDIDQETFVALEIFDLLGRHVRTLASALHQPGHFNLIWDGKDDRGQVVPSGVYVYQLRSAATASTRKMLLLR